MKYRLAGASYRAIAEKLTEEKASEYADANGIRVERAMKQIPHVSKRTAWDDDSGVGGTLARDGDAARGPDGARERPVGSGVLEGAVAVREWQRAGWPTGYRDDGTALPTMKPTRGNGWWLGRPGERNSSMRPASRELKGLVWREPG